ncbi:MAG: type II toxin-antitoxin system mRNA interferase toxin, RelE/StbE family [Ferrimicrobium sp.]
MRRIERSSIFKRDYRRIKATPRHSKHIDARLSDLLTLLATDQTRPDSSRDQTAVATRQQSRPYPGGDWHGYRECHVKPDVLLIYRKLVSLVRSLL